MINNLLPPGFKDEVFDQSATEHKYKNIIINIFQQNGYKLVKPPLIEYLDSKNEKNSFKIKEKNEKKEFVIRNDITMQIARLASARLRNKKRPLKLCYYGEVARKKGTILRPERQFLQVGAECIGTNSFLADVEMLYLAYQSLVAVGIKDISIELSSHVFLNHLLKNNIKNKSQNHKVRFFLKKKDYNNAIKYIDKSLHNFAYNLLSCSGNLLKKKLFIQKLSINSETEKAVIELLNIYKNFSSLYKNVNFVLDFSESDYLDYHKGTRFTIFSKNLRGEVARGGRYISKNNSINENSTGFNCYMDTILRASSINEKLKKILIPFKTTITKKKELIKKGYTIETFFEQDEKIKEFAVINNFESYFLNNKVIKIN